MPVGSLPTEMGMVAPWNAITKLRAPEPDFSESLELDLATVEPSLAGPRRPQDRVPLGKARESLRRVAIPDPEVTLKRYPFELSGGQQQRVAIARALSGRKPLILADEPTGNLDPEVSDEIMSLLKNIAREGTAILMATHDYRLIQKFGGTVCKLEDRSLKQVDAFQGVS